MDYHEDRSQIMTVIKIPRPQRLPPLVTWLEEHVGEIRAGNQTPVRQRGNGWEISVDRESYIRHEFAWNVTIDDEKKATLFALRWK